MILAHVSLITGSSPSNFFWREDADKGILLVHIFLFLKGRYIGENIRLVYDVMSKLKKLGKRGLIVLLDFEKAFDSLEWGYIFKVLRAYNFENDFIKWVKLHYNDPCSCVINNRFFSQQFLLERGCRQGDPLSPYLFILPIEPLVMDIKSNNNIKGIKIENDQCKSGNMQMILFWKETILCKNV